MLPINIVQCVICVKPEGSMAQRKRMRRSMSGREFHELILVYGGGGAHKIPIAWVLTLGAGVVISLLYVEFSP